MLQELLKSLQEFLYQLGDRLAGGPTLTPQAASFIGVGALVLAVSTLAVALIALRRATRMRRHYETLMTGSGGSRLSDALEHVIGRLDAVEQRASKVGHHARSIDVGLESAVQRVRLERYDASGDGAPNSFSLALLDAHDNGIVLTALAGRDRTRVYAKPIQAGQSEHGLSEEEQRALRGADAS